MTHTAVRHEAIRTRSNCDKPQPAPAAAVAAPPKPPPRHKMALLTWVGAYAVITGLLSALGPVMAGWPLALQTLLLSVLMVVTLTWVVIPTLARVFRGWLTA